MPKKYTKKKLRGKKLIGGEVISIGPGRYTSQKKGFWQIVKNTARKIKKKLTRKKKKKFLYKELSVGEG